MSKTTKILTVIERYYENGWLDFNCTKRYTALARCSYALLLAQDFYLANIQNIKATDCSKIKVDSTGYYQDSNKSLYYQERYNKAISSVPKEFREIIRLVCIDDRPLAVNDNFKDMTSRRKSEWSFSLKIDLCRGLDRLIDFYDSYEHPDDEPA